MTSPSEPQKTLLLLRHAKSSWSDPELHDHDRPLKKRGRKAAPRIGQLLAEQNLTPQLIITSSAVRALDTARLVAKACKYTGEILPTAELYHASPMAHLRLLRQVPADIQTVMFVGHNPGLEETLAQLTGQQHHFPTAALAVLALNLTNWKQARPTLTATLIALYRPRELNS